MSELAAKLQALLFIYGEPMASAKAAATLDVKEQELEAAAAELGSALTQSQSGLALISHDGKLQLATRPEFGPLLEQVVKAELHESLTPAALETLSIIAYAAPVSRAEIDYIRGVNSSYTLRALSLRGLIDREPDPKRGNAYVYGPSFDLLKHIGVYRAEDLPEYQKFRELAHSIKNAPASVDAPAMADKPADNTQTIS